MIKENIGFRLGWKILKGAIKPYQSRAYLAENLTNIKRGEIYVSWLSYTQWF